MKSNVEIQKIKELRDRLSIPLNAAIEFINEYNGDIALCEQEFHRNNINTICRLAECDEETAEKYYRICKFSIEKAIKKINEKLFFLTATPNQPIHKIGFILWAENDSLDKYRTNDKSLFIQAKDFDYIIDVFKSVYPIKDNRGEIEHSFDILSNNYFDNKTGRIIVDRMSKIKTKDEGVELFLRNVIKWFKSKLRYADYIVIYGNL
ncbi:hypothetical protein [uncultured Kordia sp.]|uniref:hypothetical protein n=1 Tax=uncultured Kordia sp. TaxID=507699 RepID=UPI002618F232|nr:hypothetical protein [uncultured Kordia sp.]